MSFHVPEAARIRTHPILGTDASYGNNGAFRLMRDGQELTIIASDGDQWPEEFGPPAWEHVSVSTPRRCPTWEEMHFVKRAFWDDEDCVVQFHPPQAEYVSKHPYCLHMWRPVGAEIPRPPKGTIA